MISFDDQVTFLVDDGNAVICLDFIKVFDTVSPSILPEKLAAQVLAGALLAGLKNGWMAGSRGWWWVQLHWPISWPHMVLPRAQCWDQSYFISFSMIKCILRSLQGTACCVSFDLLEDQRLCRGIWTAGIDRARSTVWGAVRWSSASCTSVTATPWRVSAQKHSKEFSF